MCACVSEYVNAPYKLVNIYCITQFQNLDWSIPSFLPVWSKHLPKFKQLQKSIDLILIICLENFSFPDTIFLSQTELLLFLSLLYWLSQIDFCQSILDIANICTEWSLVYFFFLYFFWPHHAIWKRSVQGSNPSWSCDLCNSCSNNGSSAHCTMAGTPILESWEYHLCSKYFTCYSLNTIYFTGYSLNTNTGTHLIQNIKIKILI